MAEYKLHVYKFHADVNQPYESFVDCPKTGERIRTARCAKCKDLNIIIGDVVKCDFGKVKPEFVTPYNFD